MFDPVIVSKHHFGSLRACLCCQRAQLAFTLSRRYRTCQCLFSLCYRTWLAHLRLSIGYHLV